MSKFGQALTTSLWDLMLSVSVSLSLSLISTTLQSDFLHTLRGERGGITALKLWSFVIHVNVCWSYFSSAVWIFWDKILIDMKYLWFILFIFFKLLTLFSFLLTNVKNLNTTEWLLLLLVLINCLPVDLSVCLSICLSVFYDCLWMYLSICLFDCLFLLSL